MLRHFLRSGVAPVSSSLTCVPAAAALALCSTSVRQTHISGWQTGSSTRDVRTREQRDEDRRARQVEKLPRPEVLHDFQYPFEKTVLCDAWFQPPVYASELDTPHLFNLYPPSDFFVYWNCSDFERTGYPAVPAVDVRTVRPGQAVQGQAQAEGEAEPVFGPAVVDAYLRKHELVPQIFPRVEQAVNMSVVFGADAAQRGGGLTRRNFWKTALLGNYMDLKETHGIGKDGPAVYLLPREQHQQQEAPAPYYTMMILTPDYPCRAEPTEWFFLHHVVANLQCASSSVEAAVQTPCKGDVVVPYVPPLPTEDAGCSRIVCVLFKQKEKFAGGASPLAFADRINYRMHRDAERPLVDGAATPAAPLAALERVLDPTAQAVSFFTTAWDIQVQEWYEAAGLPEPRYFPQDLVDLCAYNALPLDHHEVTSRHAATGAVQEEKVLEQPVKLLDRQSSATWRLSRSTLLSKDRKFIQRPIGRS